jgi:cellulose synthase/poly-beta-1,6-N-acetylglucosamine synthase-like glycosyltransferase
MISVIIPTRNEKTIEENLESLLNQNYSGRYEIIVVDDGSTDDTRERIKKFKKVKLIEQKHKGPAAARNLGVKNSKGDIVLFLDSDAVPDKNWLKHMISPFKDKKIVGVSGTYRTLNKNSLIARFAGYEIDERHDKLSKEKTIDFIGSFSAGYRKNVFLEFGGFDESFSMPSGEDPELSFKISNAGLKMVFQPKAFVYHKHPDTIWRYLKQKFWRGYWRVLLYKKHINKLMKHSYTPNTIYLHICLTGITLLSLFLTILGLTHYLTTFLLIMLTFAFTLPLSIKIFKKDKTVGIISPFLLILRNIAIGLGILKGTTLLFKK